MSSAIELTSQNVTIPLPEPEQESPAIGCYQWTAQKIKALALPTGLGCLMGAVIACGFGAWIPAAILAGIFLLIYLTALIYNIYRSFSNEEHVSDSSVISPPAHWPTITPDPLSLPRIDLHPQPENSTQIEAERRPRSLPVYLNVEGPSDSSSKPTNFMRRWSY